MCERNCFCNCDGSCRAAAPKLTSLIPAEEHLPPLRPSFKAGQRVYIATQDAYKVSDLKPGQIIRHKETLRYFEVAAPDFIKDV